MGQCRSNEAVEVESARRKGELPWSVRTTICTYISHLLVHRASYMPDALTWRPGHCTVPTSTSRPQDTRRARSIAYAGAARPTLAMDGGRRRTRAPRDRTYQAEMVSVGADEHREDRTLTGRSVGGRTCTVRVDALRRIPCCPDNLSCRRTSYFSQQQVCANVGARRADLPPPDVDLPSSGGPLLAGRRYIVSLSIAGRR